MTEELNKQFPIHSLFQNEANYKTLVVKISQFPRMRIKLILVSMASHLASL